MKPRALLSPLQLAWLAELGADTHWLNARESSGPPPVGNGAPPGALPGTGADPQTGPALPRALQARPPVSRAPVPDRAPAAASGERATLAAADLDALSQAVQVCTRCPLHAQRSRAVPGAGVRSHPLYFIVGEQPGIEDDASGMPFQGDPGTLLQAMMAAARLPEVDSAYLTNVVKCRAVGGQVPDAGEIAACLPYLHQEIARVRPRWILALGKTAAQAILGSTRELDALRGGPHTWSGPDGHTVPVWVTHHPASLLVRSAGKPEAWRDMVAFGQAVRAAQA
jgi:DNA polymerase